MAQRWTRLFRTLRLRRSKALTIQQPTAKISATSPTGRATFVNRLNEKQFIRDLRDQQHVGLVLITGAPGIGKSSVLRAATEETDCIVDIGFANSMAEALQTIASGLNHIGVRTNALAARVREYESVNELVADRVGTRFANVMSSSFSGLRIELQETYAGLVREIVGKQQLYDLAMRPAKSFADGLVSDIEAACWPSAARLFCVDGVDRMRGDERLVAQVLDALATKTCVILSISSPELLPPCTATVSGSVDVGPLELSAVHEMVRSGCSAAGLSVGSAELTAVAEFSQGLPLAVRWAVDQMTQEGSAAFNPVADDVLARVADSLFQNAQPVTREVVEACAVPRWLSPSLLRRLPAGDDPAEVYSKLEAVSLFIHVPQGLALHPEVREFASRSVQRQNPLLWSRVNAACIDFHQDLLQALPRNSVAGRAAWRDSCVELCYHTFAQEDTKGVDRLVAFLVKGFEQSDLELCAALLADNVGRQFDEWDRAIVDYFVGELQYRQGDWAAAQSSLTSATALGASGSPTYARACLTLGRLLYQSGSLDAARRWLGTCLNTTPIDDGLRAYAEEQLAKVLRMQGHLQEAISAHERAISNAKRAQADYAYASSLGSYGTTLVLAGELERGVESLHTSVLESRRLGYGHFVCTGSRSRAAGLILCGRLAEARRDATRAFQIAGEMADVYNEGFAGYVLAEVDSEIHGRVSREVWLSAIAALQKVGAKYDHANARISLANSIVRLGGDLGEADEHLRVAASILAESDFEYGQCWLALAKARLANAETRYADAEVEAGTALITASRIEASYLICALELEIERARLKIGNLSQQEYMERSSVQLAERVIACRNKSFFELASEFGIAQFQLLCRAGTAQEAMLVGMGVLTDASRHSGVALQRCISRLQEVERVLGTEVAIDCVTDWRASTLSGKTGAHTENDLMLELDELRRAGEPA
jgi:tetratricopeptide (TPR) repeat protein